MENGLTTIDVHVRGIKPLLQHSTYAMTLPKSKKVKSSEYDSEEEARLCLYKDDNGINCIPSMHFLAALKKSAVNLKKAGAGKKTLKDFVFSGLEITPEMMPLTPQEYKVDVQIVKVGTARVARSRPLFKNWEVKFQITIKDDQTWDAGTVRQVLEDAGKYQGIGDYRPLYGTFEVVDMRVGDKEVK